MLSDLYGDYYKFQKNWKLVGKRDWIRILLADILGGIGIGLILAPFFMILIRSWTVTSALSVATINALFGLILLGTGKWIFDGVEDQGTLSFAFYLGMVISLIVFLFITVGFYTRFTYIIAT